MLACPIASAHDVCKGQRMDPSDRFQNIQTRLGHDLNAHLATERATGKTLHQIAADLTAATGVAVSREAIRRWLDWLDRKDAA